MNTKILTTAISTGRQDRTRRGWFHLGLWSVLIAGVWLVLLPRLAQQPQLAERIRDFEARGIDPSAMFYTDLDAMDGILQKIEKQQRQNPRAFWLWSGE